MNIHHLRNATFVIESGPHHILVDPMLSDMGALPPFSYFRHPTRRNPVVPLPQNADLILDRVTLCLITHCRKWNIEALTHTDHLDRPGKRFLRDRGIPVLCPATDAGYMRKNGIIVEAGLNYWDPKDLLGGTVVAVPARHGHGWMATVMANGAGFFLDLPGEPSIYISGDTVYTDDVERALTELKPDIAVVAAGSARMDIGGPILMSLDEITSFIENAPHKVIANHLEALNHCPTTRLALRQALESHGLMSKTFIPQDGESISFEAG
jgi:L-ascorbate metabolism protein UlaG (beta-lactamase superfamily)